MLQKLTRLTARSKVQITALASTVILCFGLANTAQALDFNQISQVYFFGDSLTDSGFNDLIDFGEPLPPGKAPTFTTYGGFTWAQYLGRDIKGFVLPVYQTNDVPVPTYPFPNPSDTFTNNTTPLSGSGTPPFPVSGNLRGFDYAAAGSTTNSNVGVGEPWAPSLHAQITNFLSTEGKVLDPKAVFFIWSGANDFLSLLQGPMPTELQLVQTAKTAAVNVANEVATLSNRGAKRIVVLSLPNIGITPLIAQIAKSSNMPTLPATFQTITFTFNSLLNQQLGKVIAQYPKTKVLYVDVYDLLDNVILATKAGKSYTVPGHPPFKFVNFTDPACGNVPAAIFCPPGTPNGFVFSDTLHPTDMAHHLLAFQVENLIQQW